MCEEYALKMVEYLKSVHNHMGIFMIKGKRFGVVSPETYTCSVLSDGSLVNLMKF